MERSRAERIAGDVARVKSSLTLAIWGRQLLGMLTVFGFAWGVVVLAGRGAWSVDRGPLVWGLALLPLLVVAAYLLAKRRVPSDVAVTAAIDRHSHAGGLLMAISEADMDRWNGHLPPAEQLRVRFTPSRSDIASLAALAFVAAAFALPDSVFQPLRNRAIALDDQLDRLGDHIELLDDQEIVQDDEVARLRQQLQQIWNEQREQEDPTTTLEALDHLRDEIRKTAERAAESAVGQVERTAQAQTLAEAMQEETQSASPHLDPDQLKAVMDALADLLQKLREENMMLDQWLQEAGFETAREPGDTSEKKQMRQVLLSERVPEDKLAELNERLRELGLTPEHPGLLDPETLEQLREALAGDNPDRDALRQLQPQLAQHQLPASQLSQLDEEQLAQIAQLLDELGIAPDDYVLLDASDCEACQAGQNPGGLSPGQLGDLARMLNNANIMTTEEVQRLVSAGLCDGRFLSMCKGGGQCNSSGLGAFLAENLTEFDPDMLLEMWCRGGISKGPGPAKMTFTDPSAEQGSAFSDVVLPPAAMNALRDSQIVGISMSAPQVADDAPPATGSVLQEVDGGEGAGHRQTILPRHRQAVNQYFERKQP